MKKVDSEGQKVSQEIGR